MSDTQQNTELEFDGVQLKLGRRSFVVPPLSLGAIKKTAKRIAEFGTLDPEAQMELTGEIAHLALRRNYPQITREEVDELVDLRNMQAVFQAVVSVSGFTAQQAGVDGGNGTGGAASTGQPSTPT